MDRIGRLNTVKLSIVPAVASCIVIAMASNVFMVIGGRCLMGIATGTNDRQIADIIICTYIEYIYQTSHAVVSKLDASNGQLFSVS